MYQVQQHTVVVLDGRHTVRVHKGRLLRLEECGWVGYHGPGVCLLFYAFSITSNADLFKGEEPLHEIKKATVRATCLDPHLILTLILILQVPAIRPLVAPSLNPNPSFPPDVDVGQVNLGEQRMVTAILVLCGLPYASFSSVLAHEATHAWMKLDPSFPSHLPPQVRYLYFSDRNLPPVAQQLYNMAGYDTPW